MLNPKDWKFIFEVYARHPTSALNLAYQLMFIQQSLKRGRKGIAEVIEALDLAIEALYPHTDFHKIGHKLYRRTIEGAITTKQEERLRELGVRL